MVTEWKPPKTDWRRVTKDVFGIVALTAALIGMITFMFAL